MVYRTPLGPQRLARGLLFLLGIGAILVLAVGGHPNIE